MRFCLRHLLFVFFLSALLTMQRAQAAPFVSSHGYSFTPAPGWRVNTSGMMHSDVIVLAPSEGAFTSNFSVLLSPALPGQTLEEGQQQIGMLYPKAFTDFKMLSSTIGNLGGVKALDLFGSYRQGTERLWMRQALVLREGKVYTFTCTSTVATHARYDAAFTKMLQSVHWSK
jgi:hypothetical protein